MNMHHHRFAVCFLLLLSVSVLTVVCHADPITLSADTSRPEMSTFIPGEPIELTFRVTGLSPESSDVKLKIHIEDAFKQPIQETELPVPADGVVKFAPLSQKLGFYRVFAHLSNGVTLAKIGSRAAGYLTYCIVPDPALRPLYPSKETRFGMQGGFSPKINVLPYLGIRWVLGGGGWGSLEPDRPGQFSQTMEELRKQGKTLANLPGHEDWSWCKVLTTTRDSDGSQKKIEQPWKTYRFGSPYSGPPKWVGIPETRACATVALRTEDETYWRNYCQELGRSYAEGYPNEAEHIFQITWEPVYPWGFKGTDEQLIRIYEIAYQALHESDPKALVIGPTYSGMGGEGARWHARLFEKGLGKYLDGISIHPYKSSAPEMAGMVEEVRQLGEIARQSTGKELPFFGTEQGSATKEDPKLELEQARGLMRANLILLGEGYRLNVAFYIADYPGEPGYGYYYNLNSKIAFGTDKISPKPIVPAYAAQSFILEGTTTAGPIEWLGATTLGYAFERKDAVILALWDYGDKPRDVSLPVGVREVEVYDWMGNRRTQSMSDGNLHLTLTPEPVYIKGVSAALWGKSATRPLTLSASRLSSYPGGKIIIKGKVTASLGELTQGTILIEPDERLNVKHSEQKISLQRGQSESIALPINIPADAPLGLYPIKVTLRDAVGAVAGGGVMLCVASPLEINAQPCFTTDGKPQLKITLADKQGEPLNGTVQVNLRGIPGSAQEIPFTLSPRQSQNLAINFADSNLHPARIYSAKVAVKIANGAKFEQEIPVNFWQATHFAKPPTIDGDLSEWSQVPAVEIKGREWVMRSPEYYTGPDDVSAIIRYGWDEQALYVAYEVRDDVFYQPYTGFNTWKADCIQLGLNIDHGKAVEQTGNVLADVGSQHRWSEIELALTTLGPQAFRGLTFNATKFPADLIAAAALPLAVVHKDNRIIYEAAIPWTTLGATQTPKAGQIIGIAATVNDADNAQQFDPKAIGIFGGISPVKDPNKFGSLILQAGK